MTCWRLMKRAAQGQSRYPHALPPWRWEPVYHHQDGICLYLFFPPSLWWKMVWKMKSEAWYLNINFLDGHASSMGYRSPLLFFWGLIYDRQICLAARRFCGNTSSVIVIGLRISDPAFQKQHYTFTGLIIFLHTVVTMSLILPNELSKRGNGTPNQTFNVPTWSE